MLARPGNGLAKRFSLVHPLVAMVFFVATIVVTLLTYHPLVLALSFTMAALSLAVYVGPTQLAKTLGWLVPMMAVVVVLNTVFNARGASVLFSIGHRDFTLESLYFGLCIASMLAAVMLWFRLYQELMTTDRFLYLFAPLAPTLALSITMVLRWIPLTKYRYEQLRNAQQSTASPRLISALMSWSMEDAIEGADSMQARNYDAAGMKRGSFRSYRFTTSDAVTLTYLSATALIAVVTLIVATRNLAFFPTLRNADVLSPLTLITLAALMLYPLALEGREQLRWLIQSR